MSVRELVILGSSSAVPTRRRNHNGYFLRWGGQGVLFDPGEGTQRQMRMVGLAASDITRICVTHFHGDHSLGLPGIVQRIARDQVPHPVRAAYPSAGQEYWDRLRHATSFVDTDVIVPQPVGGAGGCVLGEDEPFTVTALPLRHSVPTYGYRLVEPDGWRMLPERLARAGVRGPDIARLQRQGSVEVRGRTVELAECARPRPGQVFAFVMDTGECEEAVELAQGADMLVIESTYLDEHEDWATRNGHLTARMAGRIAARAGVRLLVLTHLSERYEQDQEGLFVAQAAEEFDGPVVLAADLDRIALPARR